MHDDGGNQELTFATHVHACPGGCDAVSGDDRGALVAAGGQPGGLPGGIDAAHLHRHRADTGEAQHQHDDQRGDAQCGLDGAGARTSGQTLVLSARPMMLVSADTIESPVTTV